MKTIDPELARKNIRAAYERLHNEGVDALSAAIEQVKGTKTEDKTKTVSDLKPSLAGLLLAGSEEVRFRPSPLSDQQ
jgi:hypothetical protein